MTAHWNDSSLDLSGRTVTVNGKEHPVTLRIYVEQDYNIDEAEVMSWDGLTLAERKKLLRDFESGDVMLAVIEVRATCGAFEGSDCLGGTVAYKPADVDEAITDHGMIETAIAELAQAIEAGLKQFA